MEQQQRQQQPPGGGEREQGSAAYSEIMTASWSSMLTHIHFCPFYTVDCLRQRGELTPPVWPDRLHMELVTTRGGNLSLDSLYYDWTIKKNFILIRHQQPVPDTYDLQVESGDTYYYNPTLKTCNVIHMPVGILRPDWLHGASFIGHRKIHNIRCNCWNQTWDSNPKHDLTYCSEEETDRPIQWTFGIDGAVQDVIVYEANKSPPNATLWQVPQYCKQQSESLLKHHQQLETNIRVFQQQLQ
eukprot:gene8279-854_t